MISVKMKPVQYKDGKPDASEMEEQEDMHTQKDAGQVLRLGSRL